MPTVQSHGGPIHYEIHGHGPPLVLIHAISAGASMWAPQVEHFAATRQVITFDARGVGRSAPVRGWRGVLQMMAEDVITILDHLTLDRVDLCGISFGGVLAQQVATSHPDRIQRLVIADSYSDTRPISPGRAAWLASVYAGSVSNLLPRPVLQRIMATQYRRWPLAAEYLSGAVGELRKIDALKTRLAINRVNFLPALQRSDFPVLAIVGQDSWPRSMRFATELVQAVPHAELVRIADSNDPSSLCQPESFNAALEAFLTRD